MAKKKGAQKKITKKTTKKVVAKKNQPRKKTAKKTRKKVSKSPSKKSSRTKKTTAPLLQDTTATQNQPVADEFAFDLDDIPPPPTFDEIMHESPVEQSQPAYATQEATTEDDQLARDLFGDSFSTESVTSQKKETQDSTDDEIDLTQLQSAPQTPPKKKSFFQRLFSSSKKESTPVEQEDSSSVQIPTSSEENTSVEESPRLDSLTDDTQTALHETDLVREQKAAAQDTKQTQPDEDVHKRQEEYVLTLQRRLDSEMRERREHLQDLQKQLHEREDELEEKQKILGEKEEELVTLEQKFANLTKQQEEVENKEITLAQKENELESLQKELEDRQSALDEKQRMLEEKEAEIEEKMRELESQKPQNFSKSTTEVEDDAIAVSKKYDFTSQQKPRKVESVPEPKTIRSESKQTVLKLLQDAYASLHDMDIQKAKKLYVQITVEYKALVKEHGSDSELYQDIVDLYKDIKLAMIQS